MPIRVRIIRKGQQIQDIGIISFHLTSMIMLNIKSLMIPFISADEYEYFSALNLKLKS